MYVDVVYVEKKLRAVCGSRAEPKAKLDSRLILVAPENPSALAAQIGLAMTGRYSDASCTQTATTSIAWRT